MIDLQPRGFDSPFTHFGSSLLFLPSEKGSSSSAQQVFPEARGFLTLEKKSQKKFTFSFGRCTPLSPLSLDYPPLLLHAAWFRFYTSFASNPPNKFAQLRLSSSSFSRTVVPLNSALSILLSFLLLLSTSSFSILFQHVPISHPRHPPRTHLDFYLCVERNCRS